MTLSQAIAILNERAMSFNGFYYGAMRKSSWIPLSESMFDKDYRLTADIKERMIQNIRRGLDRAQMSKNSSKENLGGIDFNTAMMNLQVQNNGGEIKFHLDPLLVQQLQRVPGFAPDIIGFQPLISLKKFLEH